MVKTLDYKQNHAKTYLEDRERGGVVVERWTPNREVMGSIPTAPLCCVLEQDTLTPYSTAPFHKFSTYRFVS